MAEWIAAGIGLGANLGDRKAAIAAALRGLTDDPDLRLAACSGLYETPPWGVTDQPAFLNACAIVETRLDPMGLLARCLGVEAALGRVRTPGGRWGPRLIDVDVLFYGDSAVQLPGLTLPHPYMFERAFVLTPLAEIAPDRMVGGRRIGEAAAAIDSTGITLWRAAGD